MRDEIVTLVWETEGGDEEKNDVMASVESVSQSEFFTAAQTGFKAQYKISFWESDYDGQPLVKIGNERYTVYRTYMRNDQKIELYLTDKAGV